MRVSELQGLPVEARRALEMYGYRVLYPCQAEAVEAGLLEGRSLVVSSPTGSGKSLIALLAVLRAVAAGGRAVYLAPLRSLAYERGEEWSRILGVIGKRVVVATGDYDKPEPRLRSADVAVLTYEKFDSLLRHGEEWVYSISVLVVDEAHYVGDTKRGPVLETSIARILAQGSVGQVIAVSATIPNAGELADWLGARLVSCTWRPVELREGVYYNGVISWGDGGESRVERVTGKPVYDLALDTVSSGGQVLVFVQSRRRAVELATGLADIVSSNQALRSVLSVDSVDAGLLRERREHERLNSIIERLARLGIGFHHAGLAAYQRGFVEKLFREKNIKVLFATPTLAAGVNLPARRVVVENVHRYTSGSMEPISVAEYKQLAGRAGRPGLDSIGEAVIIARNTLQALDYHYTYVRGSPEPVESRLAVERNLRVQLLAVIASTEEVSLADVEAVFSRTLYAKQYAVPGDKIGSVLRELEEMNMVRLADDVVEATRLGRRTAQLYVDPVTASRMHKAAGMVVEWSDRLALFYSLWNSDAQLLRLPRRLYSVYEDEAARIMGEAVEGLQASSFYDLVQATRALYTADMLSDWINEVSEDVILEKYNIDPGDLYAIASTAEWLIYAFSEIARLRGLGEVAARLYRLHVRVKYGVREELVDIVKLPGIGRVRARKLYDAGYRDPKSIAELPAEKLARIAKGLGVQGAKRVVEKARRDIGPSVGGEVKRGGQRSLLEFLGQ